MNRRQQYIVSKYVVAESAEEAMKKSKKLPIHECYISSSWFEKVANNEFNRQDGGRQPGFGELSTTPLQK